VSAPHDLVPKPHGKTRVEYVEELMSDGVTNLGTAMALADAAGKLHGYRLTHEQAYAVTTALAAARLALAEDSGSVARVVALVKVEAAFDAFKESRRG
jgi:acyl-coenzyme A thioesterase PaaI-like protein